jgi:hypothetical protein
VFANQVVTITVNFSENVAVTGTPTLSLNDGGTATYQSGSGTNALVFSYSVSLGQYTSNLAVTAFNLPNGATIQDGGGNNANLNGATVTFSGLQISGSVVDNWISSSSGNWITVADWSSGVPNSNSDAVISNTGGYTVTLSSADTAHSLSLNDTGAIVSDNTGGSLKLAGGSGTLAITNGAFQLAGGSLQAGIISISSGGTFLIAKGTYTGSNALSETITDNGSLIDSTTATITGNISGTGTILAQNKANLTIAGTLTGSEIFTIANTAHVLISNAVSGTGSFIIANNGVLELGGSDNENVTFASGASGALKLDHSLTASFTGTIFGLTPKDSIDLADLPWVSGKVIGVSTDAIARNKPVDKGRPDQSADSENESSEPINQELVYAARVALSRSKMQVEDRLVDLSPGMAVTVEIKTGSRAIISYLLSPLLRYRQEALRER